MSILFQDINKKQQPLKYAHRLVPHNVQKSQKIHFTNKEFTPLPQQ